MKTKSSNTKKIIEQLAIGTGVIILSIANPLLPTNLLRTYMKRKKFLKGLFLKDIKRLQSRQLIDFKILDDDKIRIILKRRGKELAIEHSLDNVKVERSRNWDRKWCLIMFDIPIDKNRARYALREKFKEWQFYQLQKSVYITPWPCENQIDFIGEVFDIRKYILIFYISRFEGEEKLKCHFNLI